MRTDRIGQIRAATEEEVNKVNWRKKTEGKPTQKPEDSIYYPAFMEVVKILENNPVAVVPVTRGAGYDFTPEVVQGGFRLLCKKLKSAGVIDFTIRTLTKVDPKDKSYKWFLLFVSKAPEE